MAYTNFLMYDDFEQPVTTGIMGLNETYFPTARGGIANMPGTDEDCFLLVQSLNAFDLPTPCYTLRETFCERYMPCVVSCPVFYVENGTVDYNTTTHAVPNDIGNVTCIPPFELTTTYSYIRCQSNGAWNNIPPSCVDQFPTTSTTQISTTSIITTTTTTTAATTTVKVLATTLTTTAAPTVAQTSTICSGSPCVNGGTCVANVTEFYCMCQTGFDPSTNCAFLLERCLDPTICQNNGTCGSLDGTSFCTCAPGWYGANCNQSVRDCETHYCHRLSTCVDGHLSYSCACPPGLTGQFCEEDTNECLSDPCFGNETCVDYMNGYTCLKSGDVDQQLDNILTFIQEVLPAYVFPFDWMSRAETANAGSQTGSNVGTSGGSSNNAADSNSSELNPGEILVGGVRYPPPPMTTQALKLQIDELERYILPGMNKSQLSDMGYSLEEMLLWCRFDSKDGCIWDYFYHHQYGNCYTFNNNAAGQRETVQAGMPNGLFLQVLADKSEYSETTSDAGFRMAMHRPGVAAFPDFDGISFIPGYLSAYSMTYKSVISLGEPYNNCVHDVRDIEPEPYYYDGLYSITGCEFSYKQKVTGITCKCYNLKLPGPVPADLPNCGLSDRKCVEKVEQNVSINFDHCANPCNYETYSIVSTRSKRVQIAHLDCGTPENHRKCEIERQIATVAIHYGTLSRVKLTEVPLYTTIDALSDFGGICGLLTGISVITLVEFGYLVGVLFYWLANKFVLATPMNVFQNY